MDKDILELRRKQKQEEKQLKYKRSNVNNQIDLTKEKRYIEKEKSENANSANESSLNGTQTVVNEINNVWDKSFKDDFHTNKSKRVKENYEEDEDYSENRSRRSSFSYNNPITGIFKIIPLFLGLYIFTIVFDEVKSVIESESINATTVPQGMNMAMETIGFIDSIIPILFLVAIVSIVFSVFRSFTRYNMI